MKNCKYGKYRTLNIKFKKYFHLNNQLSLSPGKNFNKNEKLSVGKNIQGKHIFCRIM